jgi:thiamine-monophosphate kinase
MAKRLFSRAGWAGLPLEKQLRARRRDVEDAGKVLAEYRCLSEERIDTVSSVGERALVARLRSRISETPGVRVGIGDDCALVDTPAATLLTTDTLVEGIHFDRAVAPARLLGRKALSVNLSDIGAMSGVPRYALINLCLPGDCPVDFFDGLYEGLIERAAEVGVGIVGGNLSATSGPIIISITLVGVGDRPILRRGVQVGDLVVVTGGLGAAAEGLRLLREGVRLADDGVVINTGIWTPSSEAPLARCVRAQLDPTPPLAFARAMSETEGTIRAMMDLSDGLSMDLIRLCAENSVGALIDPLAVPVDPAVAMIERARGGDPLPLALHGGEDYQLLMAVSPQSIDAVRDMAFVWDLPITVIGQFVVGAPMVTVQVGEWIEPLKAHGYDHFGFNEGQRPSVLSSR